VHVQLADAIWRDDAATVRTLVTRNPALISEHVLVSTDSDWGLPMTYPANPGRGPADARVSQGDEDQSSDWVTASRPGRDSATAEAAATACLL